LAGKEGGRKGGKEGSLMKYTCKRSLSTTNISEHGKNRGREGGKGEEGDVGEKCIARGRYQLES
jgi:hypothetical protein